MSVAGFYFDNANTFCISLDSRPDRWERMRTRFEYFNMDVTRWPASTSTTVTDIFTEHLNGAQRGCAQSHINIYRHMIKNNIKYALILEDDACFDLEWKQRLNEFSVENMENIHMILLNASEPITPPYQWVIQQEQYLTGGYIISLKGARWILDHYQNCFYSADWMTTRLQLLGNSYSYFPWLIVQEGRDSTIGNQCEADHQKVLRCLGEIQYSIENHYL